MKNVEITQRLLHLCKPTNNDIGAMTLEQSAVIMDSINSGLDLFYSLLPARLKETLWSAKIRKPRTVNVNVIDGSSQLISPVFTSNEYGSTIKIAGDDSFNEIVNDKELLDIYSGSSGIKSAVVYGDTVPLSTAFTRVIGDPELNTGERLIRDDQLLSYDYSADDVPANSNSIYGGGFNYRENRLSSREVGRPFRYALDKVGMGDIIGMIRIYPMPAIEYKMRARVELAPPVVKITELLNTTDLFIPERYIGMVSPICAYYLRLSSYFDETKNKLVTEMYDDSLKRMSTIPDYLGLENNYVETASGY